MMFTLIYLHEPLPTHYTRKGYGLIFGGFQLWYPVSFHGVRVFWSLSIVSLNTTSFGVWITEMDISQNLAVHYELGAIAICQWYQMRNNLLGFCLPTEMSLRYLRLLALMLLPRDFFGSLLSVVNRWLLTNSPISSAFLSGDLTHSSKIGWPQILSSLFFQ